MAVKKKSQQSKKQTSGKMSSGPPRASAQGAASHEESPVGGRRVRKDEDPVVDERAIARKNTKPRSARESVKGPNERKASRSGKGAKGSSR